MSMIYLPHTSTRGRSCASAEVRRRTKKGRR